MNKPTLLIAVALLCCSRTWSETEGQARVAVAQLLADCAAYYLLLGDRPGMFEPQPLAATAEQAGQVAFDTAVVYSNRHDALTRVHLNLAAMTDVLHRNWSHLSIFRARYFSTCPVVMAAPEAAVAQRLQTNP